MDYTLTSTDETWLLHFTYPHSDHAVVVYLGEVRATQPSTISCLLSYAEVPIGSAISVTGSIQPTPSEGTVTLTYTRPDDTVLNRTVPIAADSTYDDLYAPDLVGEWQVTASWPGDATLDGAISTTRTFTVTAAPTDYFDARFCTQSRREMPRLRSFTRSRRRAIVFISMVIRLREALCHRIAGWRG